MKKTLITLAVLVAAITSHGQGTVQYANTSTTLIQTNNLNGGIGSAVGVGLYSVGLYVVASAGAVDADFTLATRQPNIGTVGNSTAAAGRIAGGGNPYTLTGIGAGAVISFQLRAWSTSAGSYEVAVVTPGAYAGKSLVGSTTTGGGITLPPALFSNTGSPVGTVPGFQMTLNPVPEPSTIALGAFGLLAAWMIRRRK